MKDLGIELAGVNRVNRCIQMETHDRVMWIPIFFDFRYLPMAVEWGLRRLKISEVKILEILASLRTRFCIIVQEINKLEELV